MNAKLKRTVTFVVTERCNFKCKYCYVHTSPRVMPLAVARAGIEMILDEPNPEQHEGLTLEFIGGEPLLEAELIGQILQYAHERMKQRGHYYLNHHLSSICSNGVLYDSEAAQKLIAQNRCMRIAITVDGDAAMHDQNRVYHDGRGTYADVVRNVPLWIKQMGPLSPISSKVTINHDNLHLFRAGIVHLFRDLHIPEVHANVVFENVWQPGDAELFEWELDALADELVMAKVPLAQCSLFNTFIGRPVHPGDAKQNWCGCGRYMMAIDPDGSLYPCNHFVPSGLGKRRAEPIGTVLTGVDQQKLAPYLAMNRETKSPQACLECPVATGCAWCAGADFDEHGTLDKRATFICEMHKARVRAVKALQARGMLPEWKPER